MVLAIVVEISEVAYYRLGHGASCLTWFSLILPIAVAVVGGSSCRPDGLALLSLHSAALLLFSCAVHVHPKPLEHGRVLRHLVGLLALEVEYGDSVRQ